jgi:hypothetical protein
MTRTHLGMVITAVGAALFLAAFLMGRRSDRAAGEGPSALGVVSVVTWIGALLTILVGIGVALSSSVFP